MFDPMEDLSNAHDALQEPCHRWLRCQHLLEHRRPPTPHDDALTQTACAFFRGWRHCRNHVEREQLALAHPALAEAVQFHQNAPLLQRAELEARFLAGQDDDSIAAPCGLSPAAVHIFHELFFDVRLHLQAESYIFNIAIGSKVHHGLRSDDHDILLKLAGYTLGASAVDQLLAYWAEPPVWPASLTQLDDSALEKLRERLLMQVWILSLTMPADAATAARLPAIRRLLAQASVLGQGAAGEENNPLPVAQVDLDFRALLSDPETVAVNAAMPASAEVASSAGEREGSAMPCPRVWPTVPA